MRLETAALLITIGIGLNKQLEHEKDPNRYLHYNLYEYEDLK